MLLFLIFLLACQSDAVSDNATKETVTTTDTLTETTTLTATESVTDTETETETNTDTTGPCDDPPPVCEGICALIDPVCLTTGWECMAPNKEPTEISCDGFDNDCDGEVDEDGICPDCTFDEQTLQGSLASAWDIDFDFDCNTYFTSFVSGADWSWVVPEDPQQPSEKFYGNANQNMGWALVDPDPGNRRVVVTYSCCDGCGCQAQNGITLLYTCEPTDANCGCAGQSNCPGFLDEPFIPSAVEDISVQINGSTHLSSPNGLAVGPGIQNLEGSVRNSYFVGNFKAAQCTDSSTCVPCGPDEPNNWCTSEAENCCEEAALGRLVRFQIPDDNGIATWRTEHIFEGETILGLASGRDGSILVGTVQGNLYQWDPITRQSTMLHGFDGPVLSITQERPTGDWYIEMQADPKIVRLSESGAILTLPSGVPPNPAEDGILQWGPDGRLWRLRGKADGNSTLQSFGLQ